jgi:hypothetical protein
VKFCVYWHSDARVPSIQSVYFDTEDEANEFAAKAKCAKFISGQPGQPAHEQRAEYSSPGIVQQIHGNPGDHYESCRLEQNIYLALSQIARVNGDKLLSETLRERAHEAGNTGD